MASPITLKGIDQAISNLNYRDKKTLKYRLVHTIRQLYETESSVELIGGVDTEELVKVLWITGDDPAAIKNRRKNLSSIKYSVNTNLKNLYEEGKNPEGVIIGRNNIFVMADEAKDKFLQAFKNTIKKQGIAALSQVASILNIVNEIISTPETTADAESAEGLGKIRQLKNLMQGLSEKEGLGELGLADFAAEAFMTVSKGKESTGGPDIPEMTKGVGEVVEDDTGKGKEAEPLEEVIQEEDIVQAIEQLDEDQLKEDMEDLKMGEKIEEAEAEGDLREVSFDPEKTKALEVPETTESDYGAEGREGMEQVGPTEEIDLEESEEAGFEIKDATQQPEAERDLREVSFDPAETKALEVPETTESDYGAEGREGMEQVGPTEEIDLEESEEAKDPKKRRPNNK